MTRRFLMRMRVALVLALLGLAGCPDPNQSDDPWPPYRPSPEPVDPGPDPDPDPDPDPEPDSDADHVPDAEDCAPDDATRDHFELLFTDTDGDGFTVGAQMNVCLGQSGAGFARAPSVESDCDDTDPAAWRVQVAFADADGDGHGAGEEQALCAGGALPEGYVLGAGDCAPDDPAAFQELWYSARDADGDSYTLHREGTLCAGDELPAGYAVWPSGDDCDDGDAALYVAEELYSDTDGDQIGDVTLLTVCHGDSIAGWSRVSGDCAPADREAWQLFTNIFRDADSDGHTTGAATSLCGGATLPAGYVASSSGADCNDGDPTASVSLTVYADADQDGVGEGDAQLLCNDGSLPSGLVSSSGDCAPGDGTKWQIIRRAHIDEDGDGRTKPHGDVCAGSRLLLPYSAVALGNDCNDGDAALLGWEVLYPDEDADGLGAWPYEVWCLGAELPDGYSRYGDDEDDTDPAVGQDEETLFVALH